MFLVQVQLGFFDVLEYFLFNRKDHHDVLAVYIRNGLPVAREVNFEVVNLFYVFWCGVFRILLVICYLSFTKYVHGLDELLTSTKTILNSEVAITKMSPSHHLTRCKKSF